MQGRLEPGTTTAVLVEASQNLVSGAGRPKVVTDSGVENVNGTVDELTATIELPRPGQRGPIAREVDLTGTVPASSRPPAIGGSS